MKQRTIEENPDAVQTLTGRLATADSRRAPKAPIRIALVITDLDVGGAERSLVNLATRLDRSPLVADNHRSGRRGRAGQCRSSGWTSLRVPGMQSAAAGASFGSIDPVAA